MQDFGKLLKIIGQRCRWSRKRKNVKIRQIAESLNINPATVSKFENGKIASFQLFAFYVIVLHTELKDIIWGD